MQTGLHFIGRALKQVAFFISDDLLVYGGDGLGFPVIYPIAICPSNLKALNKRIEIDDTERKSFFFHPVSPAADITPGYDFHLERVIEQLAVQFYFIAVKVIFVRKLL